MDLGLEIQKTNVGVRIRILDRHMMCANFQAKRTTLTFQHKFVQKWILCLEFQKSKS